MKHEKLKGKFINFQFRNIKYSFYGIIIKDIPHKLLKIHIPISDELTLENYFKYIKEEYEE